MARSTAAISATTRCRKASSSSSSPRSLRSGHRSREREPFRRASMMRKDLGFPLGPGLFGAVLLAIVCAIGYELVRQSMASIQKFGLAFWRTDVWDPVAGQLGALPFIWGTLYSSIVALAISTPISLGIAVFISE